MKVVFPRRGSLLLTKTDAETLESFYNTKLLTSKMNELYQTSEYMLQVGNFKYLPKHYSIRLHNATLMNISKMRELLGLVVTPDMPDPEPPAPSIQIIRQHAESLDNQKITDDNLLSHPFFQTLKPVD